MHSFQRWRPPFAWRSRRGWSWPGRVWASGVLSPASVYRGQGSSLGYGLAGVAVNVAISAAVGAVNARLGLRETPSVLMSRLLAGSGWVLVTLVTSGALLTEIAFRGYALTRLRELLAGQAWMAVVVQVVLTTGLFVLSRGWAHGMVWVVDDLVFSAFFMWRRDTWACVIAHAVPNFLAATLVATGVAT